MTSKEQVKRWLEHLESEWKFLNIQNRNGLDRETECGKFTICVEGIFEGLRCIYLDLIPELPDYSGTDISTKSNEDKMELKDCRYDFSVGAFLYDEGWITTVSYPSGCVNSFCEKDGAV